MENINIFEVATRNQFRYPFKGMVSTEDLWSLSVKDLDSIFKSLNAQIKQINEESLLNVKTSEDTILDTKIAIIKHIVAIKLFEDDVRKKAKEKRERDQKIMEIINKKQDQNLENLSIEELTAKLNEGVEYIKLNK